MISEKKARHLADLAAIQKFLHESHDDLSLKLDKTLVKSIPDLRMKLANHILQELINETDSNTKVDKAK